MFGVDSTEFADRRGPRADLHRAQGPAARSCGPSAIGSAGCAAWRAISPSGLETMVREAELEEMEKKWREENERIMHAPSARRALSRARQPDEMPPVAERANPPATIGTSFRPRSGRCREGHRRHQAAAARASDRAQAAAAVVAGDARRCFLRLLRFRQATFSPCWSSRCSGPGRASSSTPTFSRPSSSR